MRHRRAGKKLGRNTKHRRALYRNLVTALLEHERIETTLAKAKAIKPITEKMITLGKSGTLHDRRRALAFIKKKSVVTKLFDKIAPRFLDRAGGYTRIIRTRQRPGDAASMAIIELVEMGEKE